MLLIIIRAEGALASGRALGFVQMKSPQPGKRLGAEFVAATGISNQPLEA
jgi:hypothetical protein